MIHNKFKVCKAMGGNFDVIHPIKLIPIAEFDSEVDAVDFIYENADKMIEYTILKIYIKE